MEPRKFQSVAEPKFPVRYHKSSLLAHDLCQNGSILRPHRLFISVYLLCLYLSLDNFVRIFCFPLTLRLVDWDSLCFSEFGHTFIVICLGFVGKCLQYEIYRYKIVPF